MDKPLYLVFDPQDFDNYWKSFQPNNGQLIYKLQNMKTKLTLEQSQRLIELGVDPSKASCFGYFAPYGLDDAIPTGEPVFDLSDVISFVPKEIHDTEINVTFYLTIETDCNGTWLATYREYRGGEIMMVAGEKVATELIDALYELLCWTLTRNKE